jgi:hypothetical protein
MNVDHEQCDNVVDGAATCNDDAFAVGDGVLIPVSIVNIAVASCGELWQNSLGT